MPTIETVSELSGATVMFSGTSPMAKSNAATVFTWVTAGCASACSVAADAYGAETTTAAAVAEITVKVNRFFMGRAFVIIALLSSFVRGLVGEVLQGP
ncbi:hypothetical protein [Streptomyces scabiei]|uniref:hypothetical protein n=1 Tax=Streptomyces scabiei TaxID=1930 RepID=UPI002FEF41BF